MYKILVCDDEKDIVSALKIYLSAENYEVTEAGNGKEAVELVKKQEFHLIILDIMMPVMDGISALNEIRKFSNVPVIFLTADDDSTTESKGLKAGAVDFIRKPFVPEVLLIRVRHMIDLIRLQTDLSYEVEKKTQEVIAQHLKVERM